MKSISLKDTDKETYRLKHYKTCNITKDHLQLFSKIDYNNHRNHQDYLVTITFLSEGEKSSET